MAHVLFVCPAGLIPPENLVLLQHELVVAANGTEALNNLEITDAVVVDAREELAAARSSCQVLAAVGVEEPVMLLVAPESLSVVSPEWGIDDLILESARPSGNCVCACSSPRTRTAPCRAAPSRSTSRPAPPPWTATSST